MILRVQWASVRYGTNRLYNLVAPARYTVNPSLNHSRVDAHDIASRMASPLHVAQTQVKSKVA